MKIGVIRVFTHDDAEIINSHGNIISDLYGFECINVCIPDQFNGIYDHKTAVSAIPKIIEVAQKLEISDEVDGIIISCAADPAINEVREKVSVPVVGAGSSLAHLAKSVSNKIGVLTIATGLPKGMAHVLGNSLVSSEQPDGINNTRDLLEEKAVEKSLESVYEMVDAGVEVIIFACTGYITIGVDRLLREEHNMKVLSPVTAEGNAMSVILRGV